MCVALTVSILVAFNYMNNKARALSLPEARYCCHASGDNNKNNNGNNNNRATLRIRMEKRKWSASRPRLLKVRDSSVAETLPSFAFNPDPHFVGSWSILHLLPILAVVVLPPRLGQPGERAPHCLSFSSRVSLFLSLVFFQSTAKY